MYYYLQGTLAALDANFCVVDCGGVGYKLSISHIASGRLSSSVGKSARLYTHLAVREDGVELFGFINEDERNCFLNLIGVSGVGPRAAISILSAMSPSELVSAVTSENAKAIAKAQGIGNKTAARIILELRDKLGTAVSVSEDTPAASAVSGTNKNLSDAFEALSGLGYDKHSIVSALAGVDTSKLDAGEIIRLALKKMMK